MNFCDVRNHLYDEAEKFWIISLISPLIVTIATICAIFGQSNFWLGVTGAMTVLSAIVSVWTKEISKTYADKAIKVRLAILYDDALGVKISKHFIKEAVAWVCKEKVSDVKFIKPYYSSTLAIGPARLADIVAESAYWTSFLAGKMAQVMALITIASFVLVVFVINLVLDTPTTNPTQLLVIVKAATTFLSFLIASDFALLIKQYYDLANNSKDIYKSASSLSHDTSVSVEDSMRLNEEYNLILAGSPPIPHWLYGIFMKELNEAYKQEVLEIQ